MFYFILILEMKPFILLSGKNNLKNLITARCQFHSSALRKAKAGNLKTKGLIEREYLTISNI